MPFTFSHPAIILPFLKARNAAISMSALVVGSMVPDFQYFICMKLNGRFSHTMPGVIFFDIPVALVIWLTFHGLVKQPLIDNSPSIIANRLQPLKTFNFRKYLSVHPIALIVCILVGTASHIVWDGFTHHDGVFVPVIPALRSVVEISILPPVPLFRYLQHISTAVGAVCIAYAFFRLSVQQMKTKISFGFWMLLLAFAGTAFVIRGCFGIEYFGDLAVILISSFFIGLIAASAFTRIKSSKT